MFSFQKNDAVKKERQKNLSSHFALTQPDEEQDTINLAQFGIAALSFIMFLSICSIAFTFGFEGFRLYLTVGGAGVGAFIIVKFKGKFTEKLLVAMLNLSNDKLPEPVQAKALQQYHENKTKVIALWVAALVIVSVSGYNWGKMAVLGNVQTVEVSNELLQTYNAAANNYSVAVTEGKGSTTLKSLQKEMKTAANALQNNEKAVKAANAESKAAAKTDLWLYAIAAGGFEFILGLILFQLFQFVEKKQFEEHLHSNGGEFLTDSDNQQSKNETQKKGHVLRPEMKEEKATITQTPIESLQYVMNMKAENDRLKATIHEKNEALKDKNQNLDAYLAKMKAAQLDNEETRRQMEQFKAQLEFEKNELKNYKIRKDVLKESMQEPVKVNGQTPNFTALPS